MMIPRRHFTLSSSAARFRRVDLRESSARAVSDCGQAQFISRCFISGRKFWNGGRLKGGARVFVRRDKMSGGGSSEEDVWRVVEEWWHKSGESGTLGAQTP